MPTTFTGHCKLFHGNWRPKAAPQFGRVQVGAIAVLMFVRFDEVGRELSAAIAHVVGDPSSTRP
jgi:hypothetical protein